MKKHYPYNFKVEKVPEEPTKVPAIMSDTPYPVKENFEEIKLKRGLNQLSPEEKLGYIHCMSKHEIMSTLNKFKESDKEYEVYLNHRVIEHWLPLLSNRCHGTMAIYGEGTYNGNYDELLFGRISEVVSFIDDICTKKTPQNVLNILVTRDVSNFDLFKTCISNIIFFVTDDPEGYKPNLIIEYIIPFKIDDYEMTTFSVDKPRYYSTLYQKIIRALTNDSYEEGMRYFREFFSSLDISEDRIKKLWSLYTKDVDYIEAEPEEANDDYRVLTNKPFVITSQITRTLISKVSKKDIQEIMKDFCDSDKIDFRLSDTDSIGLISQDVPLTLLPSDEKNLYIVGKVDDKMYILFKLEGSSKYVFGYDFTDPAKLLMIKLDYNPNDFKFVEK